MILVRLREPDAGRLKLEMEEGRPKPPPVPFAATVSWLPGFVKHNAAPADGQRIREVNVFR